MRATLLATLLIATAVYLCGIQRNLPYGGEADESIYVERALEMAATGSLNPEWFGNPGSTTFYPLLAGYRAWRVVALIGASETSDDYWQWFFQHWWEFYFLGRFLAVAYAILSIPLIALIGRRLFGARAGITGLWFFIFYSLVVYHARTVRTDSAALFFGLLAFWFCLRVYDGPSLVRQFLAGAAIGLAIASRYFMVLLVPILITVDLMLLGENSRGHRNQRLWIGFLVGALAVVAGFLISTPYFALDFATAWENIRNEARTSHPGADGLTPVGNLIWYFRDAFFPALGWMQAMLAIGGAVLILARRRNLQLLMLGTILLFVAGISLSALHWARWIIQILPFAALLAAYGLVEVLTLISDRFRLRAAGTRLLWLGSVFIILAIPARTVVLMGIQDSLPTTRVLARKWLLENLPPTASIAQEPYTAFLPASDRVVGRDLSLGTERTLEDYVELDFDYVAVSSWMYDRFFAEAQRYPEETGFYDALAERAQLVYEIEPTRYTDGPTIRVYRIK